MAGSSRYLLYCGAKGALGGTICASCAAARRAASCRAAAGSNGGCQFKLNLGCRPRPPEVALEVLGRRHIVVHADGLLLEVIVPAQHGRMGQLAHHGDEAGDVAGCGASMLTSFRASGARQACHRSALGRAINLAGCGGGWSALEIPLAHRGRSPRSLLVPVGGFMSQTA